MELRGIHPIDNQEGKVMTERNGNGAVLSTLDKLIPARSTRLWVQAISKERDHHKEEAERAKDDAAEERREKQQIKRDAAAYKARSIETLRLAARSLMRAVPGIVLSSLGFAFASEADGDDRVALMGLLLFVAGTAAYVWAIGLTSGRLKLDSAPGAQDRST